MPAFPDRAYKLSQNLNHRFYRGNTRVKKLALVAFVVIFWQLVVIAQTDPTLDTGLKPYGSYHGGDVDSISLTNGNLVVHISIASYPQRGALGYSPRITYNNKGWYVVPNCNKTTGICSPYWAWHGNGVGLDMSSQNLFGVHWQPAYPGSFTLVFFAGTADGSSHQLASDQAGGMTSLDGTAIWYDGSAPANLQPGIARDRHGNINLGAGPLKDPNGNFFGNYPYSLSLLDTLGRTFPMVDTNTTDLSGCTGPLPTAFAGTYTLPGFGTANRVIKVCYAAIALQSNFQASGYYNSSLTNIADRSYTSNQIQSIVLFNGVSWIASPAWTFEYKSRNPGDPSNVNYGDLTKITLPTGGTISYTWDTMDACDPNAVTPASRAVTSRTLDANDGIGSHTWMYSGGLVTDPVGDDTLHTFTALNNSCSYYETQTKYFQGSYQSGKLLKTVNTDYQWIASPFDSLNPSSTLRTVTNVFPIRTTTIWPSGQVTKIEKDYDNFLVFSVPGAAWARASYGNVIEVREYGYGTDANTLPLLRRTHYTYRAFDGSPSAASYLGANLIDLVSSVSVYDGAGNLVSQTSYGYDETALQASNVGSAQQHDTTLANPGVRGNRTSESHWVNTTGGAITSTLTYYDSGTPYQNTDPGGHTTTNFYGTGVQSGASFLGAYVTQVQNALQQNTYFDYDFNTGLPTGVKDANGQVSTSDYDLLNRTLHSNAPDGSSTTWAYTDTQPPSFTATRTVTPSLNHIGEADLDGLGRLVTKKLNSDPEGTDIVDLTYDGEGRVATASNPHRSTATTTDGVSTSIYDALGRVTQFIAQDGSITSTDYNQFPIVTVTDPANNKRQSRSDALGRLVEVDEPGDSIAGTPAGGSVNISGSLQSTLVGGSAGQQATGSITITGAEASRTYPGDRYCAAFAGTRCVDWEFTPSTTVYDSGTMTAYVNGQPFTYTYGASDSVSTIASALAWSIRTNSATTDYTNVVVNTGVTPPAATISLIARSAGTAGNGITLGTGATSYDTTDFTVASFAPSVSGSTLIGGVAPVSPTAVYDAGTVTMSVGAISSTANYGNSAGQDNSPASVAADLVAKIKAQLPASSPAFSISVPMNSTAISVQFNGPGPQSASVTSNTTQTAYFSTPSFSAGCAIASNPQLCNVSLGGSSPIPSSLSSPYITIYSYDALGNLLCVEQHGNVTGTGCSAAPTSDATSAWRVRRFTYDSLSRLLTAHNPESGTITYAYDADGNLLQKTSPAPSQTGTATQTISYCYDALHRVTGKAYSAQSCPLASPVVTYTYDQGPNGIGHLTHLSDQAGTGDYTYDNMARIISETRVIAGVSKQISYEYNLDGSLSRLHYPSNRVITYTPDSAGRVINAVDSNGTQYVSSATYYANGAEFNRSMPGIFFSTTLNSRLQVAGFYSDNGVTGSFFMNKTYNYGAFHQNNGNISSIVDNKDANRTQTFTYDSLNRITSGYSTAATGTYSWGETYTIDAWGNLKIAPIGGKAYGGTFGNASDNNNRPLGFTYDAAGNLTNTTQYVYDPENRIQSTAGTAYTYDADGQRVLKSNSSTGAALKRYWMGNGNVLAEADGSGNLTAEYIYFNGKRIARIDLPANSVHYYLSDHLGSSTKIISSAGIVEEEADYTAFGSELSATAGANRYKFTSKERDSESGLDDFGARYYSSAMGRFTSADPVMIMRQKMFDPQQWNMYAYVRNNPLRLVDTNGKWPTEVHERIIDRAFPGLNAHQRAELKSSSYWMDHCATCQTKGNSYQHSMRGSNQDAAQARQQTQDFIHNKESAAQNDQGGTPNKASDIKDKSLKDFGEALHAVTDGTSPAHVDANGNPRPWDGLQSPNSAAVTQHEAEEANPTDQQMNNAVNAAQQTFKNTYGEGAQQQAITPPPPDPKKDKESK
jgi:RHS repeat-associated protein